MKGNIEEQVKAIMKELTPMIEKSVRDYLKGGGQIKCLLPKDNVREHIAQLLDDYRIPSNLGGYHYLIDAIEIVVTYKNLPIAEVYNVISSRYDSTERRVERLIRHAIETAWNNPCEALLNVFNTAELKVYEHGLKTTNKQFICAVANQIRRQIK